MCFNLFAYSLLLIEVVIRRLVGTVYHFKPKYKARLLNILSLMLKYVKHSLHLVYSLVQF